LNRKLESSIMKFGRVCFSFDYSLKKKLSGLITAALIGALLTTFTPVANAGTPTVAGGGTVAYTIGDPATSIGTGLTVTGGTAYDGQYIEFSIASSATSDILALTTVSVADTSTATVSIVGTVAYVGNGTTARQIGTVDLTRNGTGGQPLRINLAESFTNSGFELGDTTNWSFINSQVNLGVTQINGFTSNDSQNDYSPTNASPQNDDRATNNVNPGVYTSVVSTDEKSEGSYSLKLSSTSMTTGAVCDVVHGPAAYSSNFALTAGDKLYFDWSAVGGADAWDAYGYLLNMSTGAQIELLDRTGPRTPRTAWATETGTVGTTGDYSFVFVNGTWDETCGQAAGGTLYIDNIRIIGQRVTDVMIQQIARLVTYRSSNTTTLASGTKTVTFTARPHDFGIGGVTDASTTITLNIAGIEPQTISFTQPSGGNVGTAIASGASASSGLAVTLTSSTASVCTVSGLTITPIALGTCTIVAAQSGGTSGGTRYAAATSVTRSFTVSAALLLNIAFRIDWATNTGYGYMNPQYAYTGSTVVLEPNLYKKDGFTFAGWNTKADGTGTAYADRASFKIDSTDVILFAQWKLITTKPTITWATPAAIQEGTPLSATQLNALASTAGTYTYSPAAAALLPVGKHTLKVTFVPTDPKFETIEATVEIEVLAKARVTWANPAAILEGTALSATQLNATGSVPGTFSYAPASGTVLPVGKNTLKVTFTPTDTRLSAVTAEVSIEVTAKPAVIPGAPVSPTYSVTGNPKSTITWGAGTDAASYVVQVDGKNACSVSTLTCDVARLLGPKNVVNVTSIATGGKTSAVVPATYVAPASPQVLTVVNFDTARAVIKSAEARKLRTFANQINAAGFTTLTVFGHTDSVGGVDNQKLSISRANSTIAYLKRLLPNVKFVRSGFAAGEPVADNSTVEGKAANRRAEVFIP
jgi:outer membrane protein OmpA-like peptidoglycan-associated protein